MISIAGELLNSIAIWFGILSLVGAIGSIPAKYIKVIKIRLQIGYPNMATVTFDLSLSPFVIGSYLYVHYAKRINRLMLSTHEKRFPQTLTTTLGPVLENKR